MRKTEVILVTLAISSCLILWLFVDRGFCDATGAPYSSEPSGSIGAWYDETWQASGYYRLERIGSSDNFRYEYTTTPTAGSTSDTTFTKGDTGTSKKTSDAIDGAPPQHKHNYTASGASLPQDIVVTEWETIGHVHFAASQ